MNEISVIIPVRNMAETIGRAVRSVREWCEPETEILVVDDASDDDSGAVAQAAGSGRVRVIRLEICGGVAAARNLGVAEAKNERLAFLDADDWWEPSFPQVMNALQDDFPQAGLWAGAYRMVRMPENFGQLPRLNGLSPDFSRGILDYFSVAAQSDPPFCTCSVVVRRDTLTAVGGFPEGIHAGEDLLTWARIAVRFPIAYCVEPVCGYQIIPRADGRPARRPDAGDPVGNGLRELLAVIEPERRADLRRFIALWQRMRANVYLGFGESVACRRELVQAWKLTPGDLRLIAYFLFSLLPNGHAWLQRWRKWKREADRSGEEEKG